MEDVYHVCEFRPKSTSIVLIPKQLINLFSQACFCFGMAVFSFLCIRETKGRSLEDIDILFGTVDVEQRRLDVETALAEEKGVMAADAHKGQRAEHTERTGLAFDGVKKT